MGDDRRANHQRDDRDQEGKCRKRACGNNGVAEQQPSRATEHAACNDKYGQEPPDLGDVESAAPVAAMQHARITAPPAAIQVAWIPPRHLEL
jgi:hypothetical protein